MAKSFVVFVFILVVFNSLVFAKAEDKKKVFILASYEKDNVCGKPQEDGVLEALAEIGWEKGKNLLLEHYYMDTKTINISPEAIKKEAEKAKVLIGKFKPDVLVTLDDNAFREVGLSYNKNKNIKVVFSGLNGFPENYDKKIDFMQSRETPGGNITGIYEKLYVVQSVGVIKRAVANSQAKKIRAIVDYTPTGNALSAQLAKEISAEKSKYDFDWEMVRVNNWEEYIDIVKQSNNDEDVLAIYPLALVLVDADGKKYSTKEIFDWTIENSTKPEMAINYFFSKLGLFGGAAVDFRAMGFAAGLKAAYALKKGSVAGLSIDDAPEYAIVFNLKRARQLGVEIPSSLLTAADYVYE